MSDNGCKMQITKFIVLFSYKVSECHTVGTENCGEKKGRGGIGSLSFTIRGIVSQNNYVFCQLHFY